MEFANPTRDEEELARQPGFESSMSTITAKNAGAGQGANLVHCSEVGLWEGNQIDAKSVLDTLLQIVPLAPRTVICLESTARGVGNEFHARWKQAERSWPRAWTTSTPSSSRGSRSRRTASRE
jgi:hypothetical protein